MMSCFYVLYNFFMAVSFLGFEALGFLGFFILKILVPLDFRSLYITF